MQNLGVKWVTGVILGPGDHSEDLTGHCVQLKGQFWSMFIILNPAIVEIIDRKTGRPVPRRGRAFPRGVCEILSADMVTRAEHNTI